MYINIKNRESVARERDKVRAPRVRVVVMVCVGLLLEFEEIQNKKMCFELNLDRIEKEMKACARERRSARAPLFYLWNFIAGSP